MVIIFILLLLIFILSLIILDEEIQDNNSKRELILFCKQLEFNLSNLKNECIFIKVIDK